MMNTMTKLQVLALASSGVQVNGMWARLQKKIGFNKPKKTATVAPYYSQSDDDSSQSDDDQTGKHSDDDQTGKYFKGHYVDIDSDFFEHHLTQSYPDGPKKPYTLACHRLSYWYLWDPKTKMTKHFSKQDDFNAELAKLKTFYGKGFDNATELTQTYKQFSKPVQVLVLSPNSEGLHLKEDVQVLSTLDDQQLVLVPAQQTCVQKKRLFGYGNVGKETCEPLGLVAKNVLDKKTYLVPKKIKLSATEQRQLKMQRFKQEKRGRKNWDHLNNNTHNGADQAKGGGSTSSGVVSAKRNRYDDVDAVFDGPETPHDDAYSANDYAEFYRLQMEKEQGQHDREDNARQI